TGVQTCALPISKHLPTGFCPPRRTLQRRTLASAAGVVVHEDAQGLDAGDDRKVFHSRSIAKCPCRTEAKLHTAKNSFDTLADRQALRHVLVGRELDR